MAKNVFVTGINGIGKTTLVKRLVHDLGMLLIRGYYKESIIENNILKGYRLVTFSMEELIVAHTLFEGPDKWRGFGINITGFEKLVLPIFEMKNTELFIFDEIGFIECYSKPFCQKFTELLDSNIPVIATFSHLKPAEFNELKKKTNVKVLQMSSANRDNIWKRVLVEL